MINIFITNLGAYNEGMLKGEWIELPADEDDIDQLLDRIGINEHYEEYFIADYETELPIEIGEYSPINHLNEMAEELEHLGEHELTKYMAMAEAGFGLDHVDRLDNLDNYNLLEGITTEKELGEMIIDDNDDIPEYIKGYIKYESYGSDMAGSLDGAFTEYGWIERV